MKEIRLILRIFPIKSSLTRSLNKLFFYEMNPISVLYHRKIKPTLTVEKISLKQ